MMKKVPPSPNGKLAGITTTACCTGCKKSRCVITGTAGCGHPYKASHPFATQEQKELMAEARKIIARQKIER